MLFEIQIPHGFKSVVCVKVKRCLKSEENTRISEDGAVAVNVSV